MFYSERKAEDFLEKKGFNVVRRAFVKNEEELGPILDKFNFPVVMKVSGKKIVHKNTLGGIITGIKNKENARVSFSKLKKIKGFEGVMLQEQIKGKEVLIGVKKTIDFGYSVCFGTGGIYTEKTKDISFRISPFDELEAERMISETVISKKLKREEKKAIRINLCKICRVLEKNSNILELDINPLIVEGSQAVVVDARIVFK